MYHIIYNLSGVPEMKINELDAELLNLIMNHAEINFSSLARKFGVERHTIARHYKSINFGKKLRKRRITSILAFEDEIKERLEHGNSIKSIYMSLLNRTTLEKLGSYSNFKQYINRWYKDAKIKGKTEIVRYRYETPPGDQIQFDWVEDISLHLSNGELVKFNLWNATLGYSRYHHFRVVDSITEEDMKTCFISSVVFFGGIPKRALTDNMTAIVAIRGNKKYIHPTVIQFFKDLGTKLELCKVRHSYTKGKVEVSNKYQNWLNPYDSKFKTKSDLFIAVEQILNQSNYQINSETKVAPALLFKKEKGTLGKLPNIEILKSYLTNLFPKTVNISSLIDFKGAKYGVPKEYISKKVFVKEEKNTIVIFNSELKKLAIYEKQQEGIHYAKGLYNVAKMKNETEEDFNYRIEKNLKMLSKIQEL